MDHSLFSSSSTQSTVPLVGNLCPAYLFLFYLSKNQRQHQCALKHSLLASFTDLNFSLPILSKKRIYRAENSSVKMMIMHKHQHFHFQNDYQVIRWGRGRELSMIGTVLLRHPNLLDSPRLCFCASALHYDLSAQSSTRTSELRIWMKRSCRRQLKYKIQGSFLLPK